MGLKGFDHLFSEGIDGAPSHTSRIHNRGDPITEGKLIGRDTVERVGKAAGLTADKYMSVHINETGCDIESCGVDDFISRFSRDGFVYPGYCSIADGNVHRPVKAVARVDQMASTDHYVIGLSGVTSLAADVTGLAADVTGRFGVTGLADVIGLST